MAVTQDVATAEANAWKQRLQLLVRVADELEAMLERNSNYSIDWGPGNLSAGGTPITIDADGNIAGMRFTPAQLSNAIGSVDWLVKFLTNQDITGIPQGTHLANLRLVVEALAVRADRV